MDVICKFCVTHFTMSVSESAWVLTLSTLSLLISQNLGRDFEDHIIESHILLHEIHSALISAKWNAFFQRTKSARIIKKVTSLHVSVLAACTHLHPIARHSIQVMRWLPIPSHYFILLLRSSSLLWPPLIKFLHPGDLLCINFLIENNSNANCCDQIKIGIMLTIMTIVRIAMWNSLCIFHHHHLDSTCYLWEFLHSMLFHNTVIPCA